MKAFSAVALTILISTGAQAQRAGAPVRAFSAPHSSPHPAASPVAPALGGKSSPGAISRPLGGVAPPFFPATTGAGIVRHNSGHGFGQGAGRGYRYYGPVYYVPDAYDTSYQPGGYSY